MLADRLPPCKPSDVVMKPLAILLLLGATAGAADLIPQAFPKTRYAATLAKSPFILETKTAEPEAPKKDPFLNLYLRGVGKADGRDYVLIQRLGEERPMKAFLGNDPGDDGLAVATVRFGSSFRETKVVLKKGTETGEIGFKEDSINTPPPAAAGRGPALPGQMQKPGAPMPGVPMPQQMQAIRQQQPAAPVQPIPRPGGGGAAPMPMPMPVQQPAAVPQPTGSVRSRGRPINN